MPVPIRAQAHTRTQPVSSYAISSHRAPPSPTPPPPFHPRPLSQETLQLSSPVTPPPAASARHGRRREPRAEASAGGGGGERQREGGGGGEGGEDGRRGRAAAAAAGGGAAASAAAGGAAAGHIARAAAARAGDLRRRRRRGGGGGGGVPSRHDPTTSGASVAQLARVHQRHHAVRVPPPPRGGRLRRGVLRVQGGAGRGGEPTVAHRAAGAQPAAILAAAAGGLGGAQHRARVRVAEGGARVAAGDGPRHPLVQLRRHDGGRRDAHVLFHAGHRRPRRGADRVLHRDGAVRVLGDPARRLHQGRVRAVDAAGEQVPRAERAGVPDGRGGVRVDIGVVRGRHRHAQLPLPGPHHSCAGAQPGVDGGGDAERDQPYGEPRRRALLPARHAVQRAVQFPARALLQPRQRLPRLALRPHHRGPPHPRPRPQPPRGRGRVHVLLRALLPPRHERHLRVRQQLGFRPCVAEHVAAVRAAAGDGAAGGLRHHQLGLLPHRRVERRALRRRGRRLGLRHAQALHRHRLAPRFLRRLPHDKDRNGIAAGVRGLLLRLLRRELRLEAVRLEDIGPAQGDNGRPRPGRPDSPLRDPARRRMTDRRHLAP